MNEPLIAVVGPTGSGKSMLASHIARELGGEVVNCDSLQVYRYFDIGTAKSAGHLVDIIDPDHVFTAGEYARIARETLRDVSGRGKLPVIAGGTGFYLRAMIDGLMEGPRRDDALRERLVMRESKRAGSLHRILRRLDPAASRRIHANDRNKLVRAIEVCVAAKRPLTELHAAGTERLTGFDPVLIGLDPPRDQLYRILDARCEEMFRRGLIEEVQRILAMGYPATAKPFESIGYKHALWIIKGAHPYDYALREMKEETRRYAKRQWTWFKKDTRVSWIPGFGHSADVQQDTCKMLRSRIRNP